MRKMASVSIFFGSWHGLPMESDHHAHARARVRKAGLTPPHSWAAQPARERGAGKRYKAAALEFRDTPRVGMYDIIQVELARSPVC